MFSQRLRALRMARRYKQREVAEHLGVALRTYQGYEGGRTEPDIAKMILLADLLGVSLDELVGRSRKRKRTAKVVETDPAQ